MLFCFRLRKGLRSWIVLQSCTSQALRLPPGGIRDTWPVLCARVRHPSWRSVFWTGTRSTQFWTGTRIWRAHGGFIDSGRACVTAHPSWPGFDIAWAGWAASGPIQAENCFLTCLIAKLRAIAFCFLISSFKNCSLLFYLYSFNAIDRSTMIYYCFSILFLSLSTSPVSCNICTVWLSCWRSLKLRSSDETELLLSFSEDLSLESLSESTWKLTSSEFSLLSSLSICLIN